MLTPLNVQYSLMFVSWANIHVLYLHIFVYQLLYSCSMWGKSYSHLCHWGLQGSRSDNDTRL